jgi:hypothetical protein
MIINLVWAIDPSTCFEYDYIHELFTDIPLQEHILVDWNLPPLPNAVIVFNHSIDYKTLFTHYATTPYGAVHLSDETLEDDFSFYDDAACKFVIRTYLHPIAFFHDKVLTIGLGYKRGFRTCPTNTRDRYYNWSFAGNIHDETRTAAIAEFQHIAPYRLHTTSSGFNAAEGLNIAEYRALMEDSRFVLCLIGQGNIDTFRFYEALEAGAIPVVLARTPQQPVIPSYWHGIFGTSELPFIIGESWDRCASLMLSMLQKKESYTKCAAACRRLWHETKRGWHRNIATLCESAFHLSGG